MQPLEKSPKINKRTPIFIPESRVVAEKFQYLLCILSRYFPNTVKLGNKELLVTTKLFFKVNLGNHWCLTNQIRLQNQLPHCSQTELMRFQKQKTILVFTGRPLNFRKVHFLQSQSTSKQVTYLDGKTVGWQRYQIFFQIIFKTRIKKYLSRLEFQVVDSN